MENQVEAYKLWSTHVSLTAVTAWYPDAGLPGKPTLDLALRIQFGTLVVVGRSVPYAEQELPRDRFRDVVALASLATTEGIGESGVDTAIGRSMTAMELEVRRTHEKGPAARSVYTLNHCASSNNGPVSWRSLLSSLRASFEHREFRSSLDQYIPWFQQV